ncbi:MAG TPA: NAD(P)-dependent oxidoreductase [Candidatus Acidoferrales bacterium]|jgi:nucleoside-diphosphate-sugar epimerase|nr:NAD(P)-dependent oxidoreductase [Candidatus Acidoferrales bacterium]
MTTPFIASPADRILITGSNGFIGVKVVETLLEYGFFNLRCFVRPSSKLEKLKKVLAKYPGTQNVGIVTGDLLSSDDCDKAAQQASIIIHLAAGFDKSFAGAFMNSALTTRNLVEAFLEHGRPKRFVNVSSFAVYSNLKMERGALLDETSPLEDGSQERNDAYGFGKLKQEEIVRKYGQSKGLPFVIVRPGAVFGPGKPELSGRVGINTFGFFIHLGGSNELPLTFVDNCAEAIALAALKPGVDGEVFNIVDDEKMTSSEFLAARKSVKSFFSVNVPYALADLGCRLWESYSKRSQGQLPPVFNRRRASAEWKGNRYSNEKLHTRLGWKPRVKMADAMKRFLAQYQ